VAQGSTGLAPNDTHTRTMAYTWSRPEDKDELLFVLTTSDSRDATAQAMISMSLVGKANNSSPTRFAPATAWQNKPATPLPALRRSA